MQERLFVQDLPPRPRGWKGLGCLQGDLISLKTVALAGNTVGQKFVCRSFPECFAGNHPWHRSVQQPELTA